MPLYISAGLPGPFRYVKRIGGRGLTFWLLLGWWAVPLVWFAKWLAIAIVLFYAYVARGLHRAGRWAWQRWGRR